MNTKTVVDNYTAYRWFFTSSNKLVVGGKSAEQNELVLKAFLKSDFPVMHTTKPGSGFMILLSDRWNREDLQEMASFCGCFSQQWKKVKKGEKISVDLFMGRQLYKTKDMKLGTYGVRGEKETFQVMPELVLVRQKNMLRAVPAWKGMKQEEYYVGIGVGTLSKLQAVEQLVKRLQKQKLSITQEEILQALPSDKIKIL